GLPGRHRTLRPRARIPAGTTQAGTSALQVAGPLCRKARVLCGDRGHPRRTPESRDGQARDRPPRAFHRVTTSRHGGASGGPSGYQAAEAYPIAPRCNSHPDCSAECSSATRRYVAFLVEEVVAVSVPLMVVGEVAALLRVRPWRVYELSRLGVLP